MEGSHSSGAPFPPQYSTEFEKESPQYFDVYAEVQTRYSQVYWTNSGPLPLPDEIISRFAGKVMAITGYEVDQVRRRRGCGRRSAEAAECSSAARLGLTAPPPAPGD